MKRTDGIPGWVLADDLTGEPGAWFVTRQQAREMRDEIGCGKVVPEAA